MSTAIYEYVPIPLGRVVVDEATTHLPITIITRLSFRSDEQSNLDSSEIRQIVNENVLLRDGAEISVSITGSACTADNPCRLRQEFTDAEEKKESLFRYLAFERAGAERGLRAPIVDNLHDPEFDEIAQDRYVNVGNIYDSTVPLRNALSQLRASAVLEEHFRSSSHRNDFVRRDRLNRITSYLMRFFHENEVSSRGLEGGLDQDDISYIESLRDVEIARDLSQTVRGVVEKDFPSFLGLVRGETAGPDGTPFGREEFERNAVDEKTLVENLENGELNTKIQTVLKEGLLARTFGLVTTWSASVHTELSEGPHDLTLHIPASGPVSDLTEVATPVPVAVNVQLNIVSPRPRSGGPRNKTGVFAWLYDDDRSTPRYRTAITNADNELVKSFLLQDSNRLREGASREDREGSDGVVDGRVADAPDIADPIRVETHGMNQPTTGGVSFYAPVEDLISPEQQEVSNSDPSGLYYLEDLWIGFRVDVRVRGSISEPSYRSLHEQCVEYDFGNLEITPRGTIVSGDSEDYFDREQVVSDSFLDTAFGRWTGIGPAQCHPLTGSSAPSDPMTGSTPFTKSTNQKRETVPRLLYRSDYDYRIRNVFAGGVSLALDDANEAFQMYGPSFRGSFRFVRPEGFSSGELLDLGVEMPEEGAQEPQTIYLTRRGERRDIFLAPASITFDQARFHGILGADASEARRLQDVYLTSDIRGLLSTRGVGTKYFRDPDVASVLWTAVSVSRNLEDANQSSVVNETVCDIEQHWAFAEGKARFGDPGDWLDYDPIRLRFFARSGGAPRARTRPYGFGGATVEVSVPPGYVIDLHIFPDVSRQDGQDVAVVSDMANSLRQFSFARGFIRAFQDVPWHLISPVTIPRTIRVIHAVPGPSNPPMIRKIDVRRFQDETLGFVVSVIHVDASTTGTIYLSAQWEDIEDNVDQDQAISISKSYKTEARSILYEEVPIPAYKQVFRDLRKGQDLLAATQCLENTILYSLPVDRSAPEPEEKSAGSGTQNGREEVAAGLPAKIELKDGRRRIVRMTAHAVGRYRRLYDPGRDINFEETSEPVEIDVPNTIVPPSVSISHVIPTIRRMESHSEIQGTTIKDTFELSIYVDRPWLLTGLGERLAIGCAFEESDGIQMSEESRKRFVSMWGEDPIERPKSPLTVRLPRATDFSAPDGSGVQYYDNIPLTLREAPDQGTVAKVDRTGDASLPGVAVSLASFELSYIPSLRLWNTHVLVTGAFVGWVGMAIYRHQPHSVIGREITRDPVFLYAQKLQDSIITYFTTEEFLKLRIGPIYDREVTFDLIGFRRIGDGIIESLNIRHSFSVQDTSEGFIHTLKIKRSDISYAVRRIRAGTPQFIEATIVNI